MVESSRSIDIIKEIVNIGIGEAASSLSDLVDARVILKVPELLIMDIDKIKSYIKKEMSSLGVYIAQEFKGKIKGRTILCFSKECSLSLLNAIYDKIQIEIINESGISTLNEIGNIIMVSYISAISNVINDKINFDLPETTVEISENYFENLIDELKLFEKAIVIKNMMNIKDKDIKGYMFVLLSFKDFEIVIKEFQNNIFKS